jgi:hypothetical protein
MPFGFTAAQWERGKAEMTKILRGRAGAGEPITYGDLSQQLQTIQIGPHDPAMGYMLGEISVAESESGRGMFSVLVVRKDKEMQPGNGFFECAESLGFDASGRMAFWLKEFTKVTEYWTKVK